MHTKCILYLLLTNQGCLNQVSLQNFILHIVFVIGTVLAEGNTDMKKAWYLHTVLHH